MRTTMMLTEEVVRADLARLLVAAVEESGRSRGQIAHDAHVHRDALRRILAGTRSASLGEAMRILAACEVKPHAQMLLFLVCGSDQAVAWLQSDLADFFAEFSAEFPVALERILGNQIADVKPRWAKGTALRVARLLSDHIVELERKDAFLGNFFAGEAGGARV
ncbi:helix-turn-helix transcriptional regulator [Alteraurantiacibacter buctensis]|uniref:HTH cro/C1-type domain-containing protein n=1 Tax=Alteraurantiacibacter buctensis TaxID=1503981 RepID=A0A844Z1J8_9SPHN|nr:helix-turn-helix transcriptional regulator [Alteraurantiacibacter buctensis]MXO71783.1 hypothetical protein [Alteraurantiacibacter buctensis]